MSTRIDQVNDASAALSGTDRNRTGTPGRSLQQLDPDVNKDYTLYTLTAQYETTGGIERATALVLSTATAGFRYEARREFWQISEDFVKGLDADNPSITISSKSERWVDKGDPLSGTTTRIDTNATQMWYDACTIWPKDVTWLYATRPEDPAALQQSWSVGLAMQFEAGVLRVFWRMVGPRGGPAPAIGAFALRANTSYSFRVVDEAQVFCGGDTPPLPRLPAEFQWYFSQ